MLTNAPMHIQPLQYNTEMQKKLRFNPEDLFASLVIQPAAGLDLESSTAATSSSGSSSGNGSAHPGIIGAWRACRCLAGARQRALHAVAWPLLRHHPCLALNPPINLTYPACPLPSTAGGVEISYIGAKDNAAIPGARHSGLLLRGIHGGRARLAPPRRRRCAAGRGRGGGGRVGRAPGPAARVRRQRAPPCSCTVPRATRCCTSSSPGGASARACSCASAGDAPVLCVLPHWPPASPCCTFRDIPQSTAISPYLSNPLPVYQSSPVYC